MRSRLRLSLAIRSSLLVLFLGILAALLFRATELPLHVSLPLLSALGVGGSFLLADITVRPVRALQRAARGIVSGGFQRHVILHTGDELEDVADALNVLGGTLREQSGAFRHEAERLNQVLETMVEGVMVVGPDSRVVMENRALRHFLGATTPLLGRTPIEAVRNPEFGAAVLRVLTRRQPEAMEVSLAHPGAPRPDGGATQQAFNVNLTPLSWEGSAGAVAVFHDVTRVRELEALRRDFVANASHELRTPLAAIGGYVETLREVEMSEADRTLFLTRVAAHTTRLTRLIEDLLDLSRMESGQARLEIKPQPLVGPAARALQVVEALARARGVHLVNELRETLPPVIADERSMEQILVNLLDNAVKAVADGGRVTLTARVDEGRVRVSVVDDGIGIPPGDIPRLFERFFRVDRSRSREQGGTGLGLAIVKHLVHLQGGEVGVESVVGQGSTFWFTLRAAA